VEERTEITALIGALTTELSLGADAVQTDVTHYDQVKHLVDHAVQTHGRIDVILNNAGLMLHSPLERGKIEDWDRMIDVNLRGCSMASPLRCRICKRNLQCCSVLIRRSQHSATPTPRERQLGWSHSRSGSAKSCASLAQARRMRRLPHS
jgi:NAD(P)-dependent dehydrogenase (short-subunit alcohol dehydrogenase family)